MYETTIISGWVLAVVAAALGIFRSRQLQGMLRRRLFELDQLRADIARGKRQGA